MFQFSSSSLLTVIRMSKYNNMFKLRVSICSCKANLTVYANNNIFQNAEGKLAQKDLSSIRNAVVAVSICVIRVNNCTSKVISILPQTC